MSQTPYEWTVEPSYWPGQQKHIVWLEIHNEDCDYHFNDWDLDQKETGNNGQL